MDLGLEHFLCKGAKGAEFVQIGEGKALIAVFNYPGGWLYARESLTLHSKRTRGNGRTKRNSDQTYGKENNSESGYAVEAYSSDRL